MKIFRVSGLILLSGFSLAMVAQQQEPSLGDVARQNKPKVKASRVITNDDIPSRPEEPTPPAVDSGSAESADTKAEKDTSAAEAKDKATKDGKKDPPAIAAMKNRLGELDRDEVNLNVSIRDIEDNLNKEEDSDRRDVLSNMLNNQKTSLEKAKLERADITKRLEDYKKRSQ